MHPCASFLFLFIYKLHFLFLQTLYHFISIEMYSLLLLGFFSLTKQRYQSSDKTQTPKRQQMQINFNNTLI